MIVFTMGRTAKNWTIAIGLIAICATSTWYMTLVGVIILMFGAAVREQEAD